MGGTTGRIGPGRRCPWYDIGFCLSVQALSPASKTEPDSGRPVQRFTLPDAHGARQAPWVTIIALSLRAWPIQPEHDHYHPITSTGTGRATPAIPGLVDRRTGGVAQ